MMSANRLARETSPYLLQHAGNPVDWYPWGDEAFERAAREDKPVFLSIGYSACHWCHVMERESFADAEVARALNRAFVCVKVDREERPDLDQHYMSVCQVLTGAGGWPLTVVMTPDKRAFFAGTYFPKARRWGRAGLLDLVPLIGQAWMTKRAEVLRSAEEILGAVGRDRPHGKSGAGERLTDKTLDAAFRDLALEYDKDRGGFGGAPKFPMPHRIGFLLRFGKRTGNTEALAMAQRTLEAMRRGGIYDQIGFGFHRYATDAGWLVPHFEKMLYDQALLAEVYAEAFLATGETGFKRTAAEVADYVLGDLAAPEGAFYSAEDADSEGEEGRFYLWRWDEIMAVLAPEQAREAVRLFGAEKGGNFSEPGRPRDGRNVLHTPGAVTRNERIRRELFLAREARIRPFRDTKILADWNGLMIAALAMVFRITGDTRYLRAADKAAGFILAGMTGPDGRLLHVHAAGRARIAAFLDDYAFLIKGFLALYAVTYEPDRLETALALTRQAIDLFWDGTEGGFFFSQEAEVGSRRKEIYDGAVPSGNSVMLANLLRLARLTGSGELEEQAALLAQSLATDVAGHPASHAEFLRGLDLALGPAKETVIVGKRGAPDTETLLEALREADLPNAVVLFKPTDDPETSGRIERLAPFTKSMDAGGGVAAAYVCSNGACLRPVTSATELIEALT